MPPKRAIKKGEDEAAGLDLLGRDPGIGARNGAKVPRVIDGWGEGTQRGPWGPKSAGRDAGVGGGVGREVMGSVASGRDAGVGVGNEEEVMGPAHW